VSSFGVSIEPFNSDGGLDQMAVAEPGWTRIGIDWSSLEPTLTQPLSLNWSAAAAVDNQLINASNQHIRVLFIIGGTPQWAIKSGTCGAIDSQYLDHFVEVVKAIVSRYSRAPYSVEYWEMYNEPDAPILGCWGDPSDKMYYGGKWYGEMLKKVYLPIKSMDSQSQVLVGGLLLDCDPRNPPLVNGQKKDCTPSRFLEGILADGAGNSFDGIGYHGYDFYGYVNGTSLYGNANWASDLSTGPVSLAKASYLRSLLEQYHVTGKYLINSELALICKAQTACQTGMYESYKAYYIVKAFAAGKASGDRAMIWWSALGIHGANLLDINSKAPLAAYYAYQSANQHFGSADYKGSVNLGNDFVGYEFASDTYRTLVLWSKDQNNLTVTFPAMPTELYQVGDNGQDVALTPTMTLNVGVAPVYAIYK
jgi:hypothetical protein